MVRISAKSHSVTTPVVEPTPYVTAGREPFWRSILTDHQGEFDTGRILVAVVIIGMLILQGYDVIENGREFKPNDLGVGVAAVLAGFAAYLWGDTRRPQVTTTTIAATTTTSQESKANQ